MAKKGQNKFLHILEKDKKITGFQKKVYKTVLKIPEGGVRSYKWVAKITGSPEAYRAVGQALKRNPYTVTVPCHRVIREDGALGGYSKGRATKKRLLAKEGIDVK